MKRLTPGEARIALQRAWQDTMLVADWLRAEHPLQAVAVGLSVRAVASALLVIDRVVGGLDDEALKAQHPAVYDAQAKLAVRSVTAGLLVLDRVASELPR